MAVTMALPSWQPCVLWPGVASLILDAGSFNYQPNHCMTVRPISSAVATVSTTASNLVNPLVG